MSAPTLAEIKRAATENGAEPLYSQAWWREAVKRLLTELEHNAQYVEKVQWMERSLRRDGRLTFSDWWNSRSLWKLIFPNLKELCEEAWQASDKTNSEMLLACIGRIEEQEKVIAATREANRPKDRQCQT